jgi:chemotaxis signal transduction protein
MNDRQPVSVAALLLPYGRLKVVLPGALVAQVMGRGNRIVPVPGVEDWVLGIAAWRGLGVPVISLERLLFGSAPAPAERGRLVVCFPLPGRGAREFFAISAPGGAQTHAVDGTATSAIIPGGVRAELIAGAFALADGAVGLIPDIPKLNRIFYPAGQ